MVDSKKLSLFVRFFVSLVVLNLFLGLVMSGVNLGVFFGFVLMMGVFSVVQSCFEGFVVIGIIVFFYYKVLVRERFMVFLQIFYIISLVLGYFLVLVVSDIVRSLY